MCRQLYGLVRCLNSVVVSITPHAMGRGCWAGYRMRYLKKNKKIKLPQTIEYLKNNYHSRSIFDAQDELFYKRHHAC